MCKIIFGPSVCFTTTPETLLYSLSPFLPIPSHSPLQNNAVCHWKKPVAFLLASRQSFVMENCTDGVTSTLGEGQLLKTVTAQEDAKEKCIYCIILYIIYIIYQINNAFLIQHYYILLVSAVSCPFMNE